MNKLYVIGSALILVGSIFASELPVPLKIDGKTMNGGNLECFSKNSQSTLVTFKIGSETECVAVVRTIANCTTKRIEARLGDTKCTTKGISKNFKAQGWLTQGQKYGLDSELYASALFLSGGQDAKMALKFDSELDVEVFIEQFKEEAKTHK
ncbi:MAG: hypothetical protein COB67_02565 [SAR324 cluster bacterium]|uniref:Uncharacterized protein n=1 Tax=SAR324 cluster bacterium TaxID=2024889 RepID=A0A2A4T9H6_9DELT|nr:MAG: hypothetical protein COB67_02565 [SAR324 cluster bacterium]